MFLIVIISYFPIICSDIIKIRELNIAIWRHQDSITLEIQGVIFLILAANIQSQRTALVISKRKFPFLIFICVYVRECLWPDNGEDGVRSGPGPSGSCGWLEMGSGDIAQVLCRAVCSHLPSSHSSS